MPPTSLVRRVRPPEPVPAASVTPLIRHGLRPIGPLGRGGGAGEEAAGTYAGFDEEAFPSRSGGKAAAVAHIRAARGKQTVLMFGDGATDLEARAEGMREEAERHGDYLYHEEIFTEQVPLVTHEGEVEHVGGASRPKGRGKRGESALPSSWRKNGAATRAFAALSTPSL
mgnify:CR=1 FL=1